MQEQWNQGMDFFFGYFNELVRAQSKDLQELFAKDAMFSSQSSNILGGEKIAAYLNKSNKELTVESKHITHLENDKMLVTGKGKLGQTNSLYTIVFHKTTENDCMKFTIVNMTILNII